MPFDPMAQVYLSSKVTTSQLWLQLKVHLLRCTSHSEVSNGLQWFMVTTLGDSEKKTVPSAQKVTAALGSTGLK